MGQEGLDYFHLFLVEYQEMPYVLLEKNQNKLITYYVYWVFKFEMLKNWVHIC